MGDLPSHASVVVIGGGVMGCSTLYHLAKNGVSDAVLLERNKLTSGTTWHSAAQVRALRSTKNLTDLVRYSISLYSQLEAETGQQVGWINKGSLSIATTADRLTHIGRQEALAALFGVQTEAISAGEAKERWPLMNAQDVVGAVWSPDDGRVSPSDLCSALVQGARSHGARVFEDSPVTGIRTRDSRVIAVETTTGEIRCDAVAICAGLWSRQAAGMAGVQAPVWPCEHFYLLTKPIEGVLGNLPTLSDHDSHLYIRDDSGGLLVGCFEPMGKPIDPERLGDNFAFQLLPEDWDHFEPMMLNALHRLPALESAQVKMLLNGPESFTPDGAFLLGETAETRGVFLGCGMNSVGIATGGGAGMALAHCIQYGRAPADLHEADPKRFAGCFNSVEALTARAPEVLGKHYEVSYPGRNWLSARNLRRTPLHDRWVAANAHFTQVFGWERPVYFGKEREPSLTFGKPDWFENVRREARQAHERAAIFDQSTFGKIEVEGPDAEIFLNRVCSNDMARAPGRAIYTTMLNERGGIEGDLTSQRITHEHYRLNVGSGAIRRDLAWLRNHLDSERVRFRDSTQEFAILGLMGPEANAIAEKVGAPELNELRYFHAGEAEIAGAHIRAVRLSYVGEPGWEITCRAKHAARIYDALHAEGARPAGAYAQTSMRVEKRFLAYGHDIDTDISPIEAGIEFSIGWDTDFIGREALVKQRDVGCLNRIVSLLFEESSANPLGNEIVRLDGEIAGKTTSAAFGHRLGRPVALAHLFNAGARAKGALMNIDIGGVNWSAKMVEDAAYDPTGSRMRRGLS
ncbi:MAG: FAD-dependent oxidoreductase [Rhodobacteraceae bacterium]|nr:FAD-dependent oxidoreductase [Paracoccaceae bacterium]